MARLSSLSSTIKTRWLTSHPHVAQHERVAQSRMLSLSLIRIQAIFSHRASPQCAWQWQDRDRYRLSSWYRNYPLDEILGTVGLAPLSQFLARYRQLPPGTCC